MALAFAYLDRSLLNSLLRILAASSYREASKRLKYLDQSQGSKWQMTHSVEKQLLPKHLASILNKGLDFLLEENRIEDLQLMYSLLGRVKDGQVELCSKMAEYVKKSGKSCWMSIGRRKLDSI